MQWLWQNDTTRSALFGGQGALSRRLERAGPHICPSTAAMFRTLVLHCFTMTGFWQDLVFVSAVDAWNSLFGP